MWSALSNLSGSIGSALGSVGSGVGGIFNSAKDVLGGVLSYKGQKDANEANVEQSQANRSFQERMSSTAYQRAMADLKQAGLNPILAARSPASTPGGAQAVLQNALGAGVQGYNATAQTSNQRIGTLSTANLQSKQGQLTEAQTERVADERKKIQEETALLGQKWSLTGAQTRQVTALANKLHEDIWTLQAQREGIKYNNALKKIETEFFQKQDWLYIGKQLGLSPGDALNLVKDVFSILKRAPKSKSSTTTTNSSYTKRRYGGESTSTTTRTFD